MPENVPLESVDVWFQDEARVGQKGRLTRLWHLRGGRKRIPKDSSYTNAYIYGAICPSLDIGEAIIIDCVCKQATEVHLQAISKRVLEKRHAVIVMDKAPWHKTLKLPSIAHYTCHHTAQNLILKKIFGNF